MNNVTTVLLLLLPVSALVFLLTGFYTSTGRFRPAFVSAAVVWGAILFGITEILSWFDAFARGGIAMAWFAVDLAGVAWLWRITDRFSEQWRRRLMAELSSLGRLSFTWVSSCPQNGQRM